jgi:magnesium transporter
VIVDSAHYAEGTPPDEQPFGLAEAGRRSRAESGFVWMTLSDPTPDELSELRAAFALPARAMDDARALHARPTLERHGDDVFLLVKTVRYDDANHAVAFGEVDVFLGAHRALVIGRSSAAAISRARARLDERPELADLGPIVAAWAVVEEVIDGYEPVLDRLSDDLQETEQAVFEGGSDQGERIYLQYREVGRIARVLQPLQAIVEAASEVGGAPEVPADLRPLVRDLGDHARRLYADVVLLGEALDRLLNANLAGVTVRQNRVLQKLSAWAAIAVPPTIVTGVYGMNFRHVPEFGWRLGYPLVLLLMVVLVTAMWRYFRRLGWI